MATLTPAQTFDFSLLINDAARGNGGSLIEVLRTLAVAALGVNPKDFDTNPAGPVDETQAKIDAAVAKAVAAALSAVGPAPK